MPKRNRGVRGSIGVLAVVLSMALLVLAGCSQATAPVQQPSAPAGDGQKAPGGSGSQAPSSEQQAAAQSGDAKPAAVNEAVVSVATHPTGTSYHAVGSAVAKVVSQHSPVKVTVKPFSGPNAWMALFNKGDVELGVLSSPDAGWALGGITGYKEANKNIRLLMVGNNLEVIALTVRKDSGITKVGELKGKRVSSDYAGNQIIQLILESQLAGVGLSWDDVKRVPVPDTGAGLNALRENRVDAAFGGSAANPGAIELHAAKPIIPLNFGDIPASGIGKFPGAAQQEMSKRVPGSRPVIAKSGIGFLTEDAIAMGYPLVLIGHANLSEEAAYQITKSLYGHYQELHPVHPWLRGWLPDRMFDPNPVVPYHAGAMRFWKEKGLWTDAAENNQKARLAQVQ